MEILLLFLLFTYAEQGNDRLRSLLDFYKNNKELFALLQSAMSAGKGAKEEGGSPSAQSANSPQTPPSQTEQDEKTRPEPSDGLNIFEEFLRHASG